MKYIIGIDSGGTSSKACLGNTNQILSTFTGSGMNPYAYSSNEIQNTLKQIIEALLTESQIQREAIALISICGAGLSRQADQSKFLEIYHSLNLNIPIAFADDAMPLLYSHFRGSTGVLLISGTGSIAYGKDHKDLYRCGGHGHILSDEGSGYWIALEAIKSIFKSADDNRVSSLQEPILSTLALDTRDDLLKWVHHASKKDIASLASIVLNMNSQEGALISLAAAEHLTGLIDCVISKMPTAPKKIILSGSILKHSKAITSKLKEKYPMPVEFSQYPAEFSAMLLGFQQLQEGAYYD